MSTKSTLFKLVSITAISILFFACKKGSSSDPVSTNVNPTGTNGTPSAWARQFTDDFNDTTSFKNWMRTNRADYNSSICNYQSSNPTIANYDSKNVLVLTASGSGSNYTSGHVKSNYSFKPANNEQYRVSAQIKLIALNGSNYVDFTQTYGAWPAFWTIQETNWPTNGEIDMMEAYSFGTYANYASNLFYGTATGTNQLGSTCQKPYSVSAGWHMYDEYWKNQNGAITITIQLDGVTVSTYTNAINGNLHLENFGPHNIILNLNVGSNSNVGIFNNSSIKLFTKTMMWVDYVTVDKQTL